MDQCHTCELTRRRENGDAPLWDNIYTTKYWQVVHSYNTALPGWLVVISRQYLAAIDEMNEEQAIELGVLIWRVSMALRDTVGCDKTYVAQFAETPGHQHVHFHVVPRMSDQPAEYIGSNIFKYLGVPEEHRVNEEQMNEIARRGRQYMTDAEAVSRK